MFTPEKCLGMCTTAYHPPPPPPAKPFGHPWNWKHLGSTGVKENVKLLSVKNTPKVKCYFYIDSCKCAMTK